MPRIERYPGTSKFGQFCEDRGRAYLKNNYFGMFYRLRKPYKMEECLFEHLYGTRGQTVHNETVRFDYEEGVFKIRDYDLTQFYNGTTTMQASVEWYDDIYLMRKDSKLIKRDWLAYMLGNLGVELR